MSGSVVTVIVVMSTLAGGPLPPRFQGVICTEYSVLGDKPQKQNLN